MLRLGGEGGGGVEHTSAAVILAGNGNDRGRPRRRLPNGVKVPRPVFGGEYLVEGRSISPPVFKMGGAGGDQHTTGRNP